MTNRDQLIQKAEGFILWLDRQIDGLEVKADRRNRLATGCLEMALEHQRAVILLIANNLHGSAFALIRPLFEACVRGIWLSRCATETELKRFADGKDPPSFGKLCTAVETLEGFEAGVFSLAKANSWRAMSGFTHTGIQQIVRRHTEETIESNYDEVEVLEAINFALGIGWLAAIAICEIAKNAELPPVILQKVKELFPSELLLSAP